MPAASLVAPTVRSGRFYISECCFYCRYFDFFGGLPCGNVGLDACVGAVDRLGFVKFSVIWICKVKYRTKLTIR